MQMLMGLINHIRILLTSSISVYHNYSVSSFSFTRVAINNPPNISSTNRRISSLTDDELLEGCCLGLDSHADISCAGKHARVNEVFHGQTCNVTPFNDSYSPMQNIHTASVSYATDTADGQTYVINVNQSLDFTSNMSNLLLYVNQVLKDF